MKEMKYRAIIGLEIHAELKTATKMFCRCRNDALERRPNWHICPVCTAQPGALPVANLEAVRQVLRVGTALGGQLADFTEFDRKNYFYPDIPKGYQISQYEHPLVSGGSLREVAITRVHLEEDTAKSTHSGSTDESLIDFNRSGLPLMELVTEPVIHDAKTAVSFAKELQLLLRYLEASEANMEQGQMRVEANISVQDPGWEYLKLESKDRGPYAWINTNIDVEIKNEMNAKVEVKNLNSFRAVERAVEFEIKRQTEELEAGRKIIQETRGWDETNQRTFSQRKKESSHDYRYFPEPDLPKIFVSEILEFQNLAATLPELPWQKRERYEKVFGLKSEDVEVFVADLDLAEWFDEVAIALVPKGNPSEPEGLPFGTAGVNLAQTAANYVTSDIAGARKAGGEIKLPPAGDFAELVKLVSAGEVSSRGAKDILAVMLNEGGKPKIIAEAKGLYQVHDESAIGAIVDQVIAENQNVFAEYRAGKEKSLQFLIGQAMKASRGAANPTLLAKLFAERAQKS
ncbi:glutaminyl-tRNA synthase (glutamine-hydrolyzing) subunit B [bacterium CG10_49_38]|nr:MAG: glutaminyl-tRNA synthase (glutamine-hydrolyzing) subunit B [bacterium CG10_49_38]